jgi:putative transcriptional regulator
MKSYNMKSKRETFGQAVISALEETLDDVRAGKPLTRRFVSVQIKPGKYSPGKVRHTRQKLGVSQAIFAEFLGTSLVTVQSWERGVRDPSPMARRFLDELNFSPEHWRTRLINSVAQHPS